MIIPVGHESDTVRRLPWVTFTLMAICFVAHMFISSSAEQSMRRVENAGRELLQYIFEHPYLEFDPEAKEMIFGKQMAEEFDRRVSSLRTMRQGETHLFVEEEQEELNRLTQSFLNAVQNVPYREWGYIPAEKSTTGLLTYMFIHGGWMHLLGNLLILYLMGPFIEDVWGRPLYLLFYLAMGVLAALSYGLHYPDLQGPLIGASGAIAGVMGAFLIRYLKTKITFFYFFFPFFRGTFQAPAWLMLPLWLFLQLFNARMIDAVSPEGGGGVAYWAHVWGFVLGALVALGFKVLKIEEKYIHHKIEKKTSTGDEIPKAINEVIQRKNFGKLDEAFELLNGLSKKAPNNPELAARIWELGTDIGMKPEYAEFFLSFIEREIRRGQMEMALDHFRQVRKKHPQAQLHPTYTAALVKYLSEQNESQEAVLLASESVKGLDENSSPGLLLELAPQALKLDVSLAEKVVDLCDRHPEIQPAQKNFLKQELTALMEKSETLV